MSDDIVSIPRKSFRTLQFVAKEKYDAAVNERDALKAEVERLRVIIEVADKNRREIGTRCRIAEQEETRLTAERDALKAALQQISDAVMEAYANLEEK